MDFGWAILAVMAGAAAQNKPAPDIRAEADRAVPPRPINREQWITPGDYPPNPRDARIEGVVGVRLVVDTAGRVAECTLTSPSGNAELDTTTCFLMVQRARFEPARSPAGKPIAGTATTRIHWRLEDAPPPRWQALPQPWRTVRTLTVESDGTVSDCVFESSGVTGYYPDPCEGPQQRFAPRPGGKRQRVRIVDAIEYLD